MENIEYKDIKYASAAIRWLFPRGGLPSDPLASEGLIASRRLFLLS